MSYNEPPPPPPSDPTGPPPQSGYGGAPQPGMPVGTPRPAELLNRFLARLIDHVLLGIVFGVLWVILSSIFLRGFTYSLGEWFLFYLFFTALSVAASLAYFGFLESNRGQTVGKMLLKLRTYGPDGVSNPTLEQALKRNGYVAINVISIVPILGPFIAALATLGAVIYIAVTLNNDQPNHQGWHDKFAGGTRVLQIG